MNARVNFKPETLHQTGTVGLILTWCQDHPKLLKNTNLSKLAEMAAPDINRKTTTLRVTINKMHQNQMLLKQPGGKRRGNIKINYYHKDIPGYILERAPIDTQEKVRAMYENLENDQYVNTEGCVVTPGHKLDKVEPKVEQKVEPVEDTVSVPVTVEKTVDGMHISINLNLNLNLNR